MPYLNAWSSRILFRFLQNDRITRPVCRPSNTKLTIAVRATFRDHPQATRTKGPLFGLLIFLKCSKVKTFVK